MPSFEPTLERREMRKHQVDTAEHWYNTNLSVAVKFKLLIRITCRYSERPVLPLFFWVVSTDALNP